MFVVAGVPKYKTGITNTVMDIMVAADRSNLPYLEKKDIIKQVKMLLPGLRNAEQRVSQAIYQLQQPGKIQRQRIKKVGHGKYRLLKETIGLRPMMSWIR